MKIIIIIIKQKESCRPRVRLKEVQKVNKQNWNIACLDVDAHMTECHHISPGTCHCLWHTPQDTLHIFGSILRHLASWQCQPPSEECIILTERLKLISLWQQSKELSSFVNHKCLDSLSCTSATHSQSWISHQNKPPSGESNPRHFVGWVSGWEVAGVVLIKHVDCGYKHGVIRLSQNESSGSHQ